MDFLGWYTSGDAPDDRDIKIHKQICEINESPVLLKLNPMARHSDVSFLKLLESGFIQYFSVIYFYIFSI